MVRTEHVQFTPNDFRVFPSDLYCAVLKYIIDIWPKLFVFL
jgi:hypothetical protein